MLELTKHLDRHRSRKRIQWWLIVLGVSCLISPPVINQISLGSESKNLLKYASHFIAFGCGLTGYLLESQGREFELAKVEWEAEKLVYARFLKKQYEAMFGLAASPLEPVEMVAVVESVTLEDVGKESHVLIVGSTGNGKSTIATELCHLLPGQTIVIDPHAAPDDWQGFQVVGSGRNYEEVAEFLQWILTEMDTRYQQRSAGVKEFEAINVIVDETAAIAKSEASSQVLKNALITLGCEARKVKIRLIIISQGKQVKILNLEGQSDLRENFCHLRLGKFAKQHAKTLGDEIMAIVSSQKRAAMLDDSPLDIPDIKRRTSDKKAQLLWKKSTIFLESTHQHDTNTASTHQHDTNTERARLETLYRLESTRLINTDQHDNTTPQKGGKTPSVNSSTHCLSCGSESLVFYGKTLAGSRRLKCKNCGKTSTLGAS